MNKIIKAHSGKALEWEPIIIQYNDGLVKFCYSILCNYADAEDAVQITFVKAITKSADIEDSGAIKSYLFKTAYRTSIDIIRKRRLKLYSDVTEYERGYTENYDSNFPDELKTALKHLSPIDRGLLYQRVVNNLSYKELSSIYGKSESTLRKRYERARKKMEGLLRLEETTEARMVRGDLNE